MSKRNQNPQLLTTHASDPSRSKSKMSLLVSGQRHQEQEPIRSGEQNFESHRSQSPRRRHIGQDLGQLNSNKRASTIGPSSQQRFSGASTPIIHPTPMTTGGGSQSSPSRRYLVLLQDSLAIKFVPCAPQPLLPNVNVNHNNELGNNGGEMSSREEDVNDTRRNRNRSHLGGNEEGAQQFGYASNSCKLSDLEFRREQSLRKSFSRPGSSASMTFPPTAPVAAEIDHSLHGIYLYKGFREANLHCHWNTALHEAVRNLEYKGYIVPFTVLISAINPRFLTTIRVAWARQMLRSPPGYRIELIGEIEELLADPIQQSQFAPLSDSLCWAILEVTSSGQEAFVDSILTALTSYFPTMIMPNRELVYQTLEKLIKDRKVYQTSSGYFVVTPDTFRYMVSTSPLPQPLHESSCKSPPPLPTVSTTTLTLDTSSPIPSADPQLPPHDPDKVSRNSWDSTVSAENPVRERGRTKQRRGDECQEDLPLRRHNSLKMIRQRDKEAGNSLKFLRGRSLSFRLYKSKSTPIGSEGVEAPPGKENKESSSKNEKVEKKVKSGKSFFKKLFRRSSSSKKSNAEEVTPPASSNQGGAIGTVSKSSTAATQTSSSEALELQQRPNISGNGDQKQGRTNSASQGDGLEGNMSSRPVILQIDCDNDNGDDGGLESRWNSLPRPERSPSRLSSNTPTLLDDGNLYSYATQSSQGDAAYPFPRDQFSRCSSLSRGTSLGYGSQGPPSSLIGVSQSPTPSMSPSNYAGYSRRSVFGPPPAYSHMMSRNSPNYGSYKASYDHYRRRYPGFGSYRQHLAAGGSANSLADPPRERPTATATTGTRRPNSQSHYYETIGFPSKSPPSDPQKSTMTEGGPISGSNPKKSESHIRTTFHSPRINKRKGNEHPFVSTTTVTQKSTTNMEVELRLPLGKFMSKGGGRSNGGSILINGNDTKFNVNLGNGGGSECPGGPTKIHIEQPRSETEVMTTVSHCNGNGTVKAHFDCCDNSGSGSGQGTSKDTNENLSGFPSKSQANDTSGSGNSHKPPKLDAMSSANGIRRESYDFAVK